MKKLRIACLQFSASADFQENLSVIFSLVRKALLKKPDLIALPENFYWRGPAEDLSKIAGRAEEVIYHFQIMARKYRVAFLLGSVIELSSKSKKYYNTSVLISEKGKVTARYRKIHLFAINMPQVKTDESRHVTRGDRAVVGNVKGIPVGLSICYDLRFPELYRQLVFRGAKILFIPSNFTYVTGKAHWETLLRARAIENQAFVVAPGQVGTNPSNKIKSFGTSLIIDPWGTVLAKGSDSKNEVVAGDLNLQEQAALRKRFPVLEHRFFPV